MAITKLMHMKESPGWPHTHLKNAIEYILNEKKTQEGILVGGNSGADASKVLETFLETKKNYEKPDGRQGYHFVISFAKGESEPVTVYEMVQEFCEQYLGDNYDYVFAVHDDKDHLHGHIIFNSVSRTDGYKYHYQKGDWKKYIQPITDEICERHGLAPLIFEENRAGVSYASWAEAKKGKCNWGTIIQADVDYAVQQAETFVEFSDILKKMGYELRIGQSRKQQADYITYRYTSPDGKTHSRRSYNMPPGYGPGEILTRLKTKGGSRSYEELSERLSQQASEFLSPGKSAAVLKSTRTYQRLYQAVSYYKLPNPYAVPARAVRGDMLKIDRLLTECRYLKEHNVTAMSQLTRRARQLEAEVKQLEEERRKLYRIKSQLEPEQLELMEEYTQLQEQLLAAGQTDKEYEERQDRIEELVKECPHEMLETDMRLKNCGFALRSAKKELKLLKRILETETRNVETVVVKNTGPHIQGEVRRPGPL